MKKLLKNKKGFTLVEVIVVLVIIAILIAIAVPSVMKYIDDANEAKYLAEARAAYVAAEAELTKDYADNKAIDFSIYGETAEAQTIEKFKAAINEACGFDVTAVVVDGTAVAKDAAIIPNQVKKYKLTFDSPSTDGKDATVVEITKNGTAKLIK